MTQEELTYEHHVIMETRLGILCGNATPTPAQFDIAKAEADQAISDLQDASTI